MQRKNLRIISHEKPPACAVHSTEKGIDIIPRREFDRLGLPVVDLEYRIQNKHQTGFDKWQHLGSCIREGHVASNINLLEDALLLFATFIVFPHAGFTKGQWIERKC